mgnify:CR=1 FL=1
MTEGGNDGKVKENVHGKEAEQITTKNYQDQASQEYLKGVS